MVEMPSRTAALDMSIPDPHNGVMKRDLTA